LRCRTVAQPEVGAVGLLGGFLGQLDATVLEHRPHGVDVVGREEDRAGGGTLGDQLAGLRGRRLVQRGRPRPFQQDLSRPVTRHAHGEPAHEAEILVVGDLQAEPADVEVERLVLVEHEQRRDVYPGVHGR
jgi:hypothetical protein